MRRPPSSCVKDGGGSRAAGHALAATCSVSIGGPCRGIFGCYLAGTGKQPSEQAFVPGVFQRLTENQSSVAWTDDALAEDGRFRRWAMFGYIGLALVVAVGGALYWIGRNQKA